jgi:hypothetical protein
MAIRTELNLRLPNSPGALAAVCTLLADERVNITALELDSAGQLRLVVDNHVHAAGVLRERHYHVVEREVILAALPAGPGSLAPILQLVAAAGVNVDYAYATAAEGAHSVAVVLGVADPARAATAAGV